MRHGDTAARGMTGPERAAGRTRAIRWASGLLGALALALALGLAGGQALGQGVPGGPDLPPPDVAPAPAPAPEPSPPPAREPSPPPSNPDPAPPPSSEEPSEPTPEELEQQRQEEAQEAREEEAAQRRRQAERRRQELLDARRERAEDFRELEAYVRTTTAIELALQQGADSLDRASVAAALQTSEAADPAGGEASGEGRALLVMLLAASGLSAALVLVPFGLRRRSRDSSEFSRGGALAMVRDRMAVHLPFVERHRVELVGVSVGCLLVALLVLAGLF